jgi:DNA-binding CsgD family transcriptional regulator/GAF domain-containing protein
MPSTSHDSSVTEINRSISRCESYDGVVAAILRPIMSRLGASAGAFFQVETDGGRPLALEKGAFQGPFTEAAARYRSQLFREDPLFRYRSMAPILLSDMLSGARRPDITRDLRVYQRDFLARHGIGDIIGLHFPVRCGARTKIVAVSFQRRAGMQNYTSSEIHLMNEVTPALKLALTNLALDAEITSLAARIAALPDVGGPTQDAPVKIALTQREIEIVDALRAGHSNASMAQSFGLSVRTVENHLRSIYAKATVNSRTQLLAKLFQTR